VNDNKFKIGDKALYTSPFGMKKVDKFKCKTFTWKTNEINKMNKILAVAEDESLNAIKYLAKRIAAYNAEIIDETVNE